MRYTLLLHYPEATAEDIGQEAIEAGQAAFHAYATAISLTTDRGIRAPLEGRRSSVRTAGRTDRL